MADKGRVLDTTEGLCTVCLATLPANVVERGGGVFLEKTCPDHGPQNAYIWPNADHYRWIQSFRVPSRQPVLQTAVQAGCPRDCGLCGVHAKAPALAEIEVTRRCNLRCPVCFMAAERAPADPSIEALAGAFMTIRQGSGVQTAVQLTGGEPTVRDDLPEILRLGRALGFRAMEINTNGVRLARDPDYARILSEAGATGIYLQFDGLTREVYPPIRGADLLDVKLLAIEHCRRAGIQVVLAMTVIAGLNERQLGDVLRFALDHSDVIAGIAFQPAFSSGRFDVATERRLSMGDVVFLLAEQCGELLGPYDFWPLGNSHPLCSCSTYLVNDHGRRVPFTRLLTPQGYVQAFDPASPQGSVFADLAARYRPDLEPGLSIVVMNYMDAWTADVKRLKECSMVVATEDDRLIPFCAYHLSDGDGKRLYPAPRSGVSQALSEAAHA